MLRGYTRLRCRYGEYAGHILRETGSGTGSGADEYDASLDSHFNELGQQRIARAAETEIHHLRLEVDGRADRLRQRERVAAGGVGVIGELPAGLERDELDAGCNADDAEVIVRERRDHTRDLRSMPVL